MNEKEQLMWGSHLPALMACIGATTGAVLEVGIGNFSTPVLHAICGAMNRTLISAEEDPLWLERFRFMDMLDSHFFLSKYFLIDGERPISVAFIDHSPGGKSRADAFVKFLPISDYVIVHDYWQDNEEAIAPILTDERIYRHITRFQEPPTLVASRNKPIPASILHL